MDLGPTPPNGHVLIVGATGVIGSATLAVFLDAGWRVTSVSRRRPVVPSHVGVAQWQHVAIDLTDASACAGHATAFADVTHVFYAALFELPGLIPGWTADEQMQTNLRMLENLMGAVEQHNRVLRQVTLLQGTKAYGAHLHAIELPAREDSPRDPHENFYWLQEDFLKGRRNTSDWSLTILRPQIVFGDALGSAMNLIPVLGVYAALRQENGRGLAFPGGSYPVAEAVDAELVAQVALWAAETPAAKDSVFNVTNGDVFTWSDVWPVIAESLGVAVEAAAPLSLAEWLPRQEAAWADVVRKHDLLPLSLADILGESHHYADALFGYGVDAAGPPALVSTIKLRQAGFHQCCDTRDMFRRHLARLIDARVVPRWQSAGR